MTTGVDTRLDAIVRAAKARLATDLSNSSGQPIIAFCDDLINWVVSGQRKPTGAPTERVRSAVRAAVNVGLAEVYGSERSSDIDSGIRTRRDVL